jgi:hypothetical protein
VRNIDPYISLLTSELLIMNTNSMEANCESFSWGRNSSHFMKAVFMRPLLSVQIHVLRPIKPTFSYKEGIVVGLRLIFNGSNRPSLSILN